MFPLKAYEGLQSAMPKWQALIRGSDQIGFKRLIPRVTPWICCSSCQLHHCGVVSREKNRQFHNSVWCNSKRMEEMDRPESLCSSHQVKNKTLNCLINFIPQTAYSLQLWKTIQFWKYFEDSVMNWNTNKYRKKNLTKIPLSILSSVYMFPYVKIANRRPVRLSEVYGL